LAGKFPLDFYAKIGATCLHCSISGRLRMGGRGTLSPVRIHSGLKVKPWFIFAGLFGSIINKVGTLGVSPVRIHSGLKVKPWFIFAGLFGSIINKVGTLGVSPVMLKSAEGSTALIYRLLETVTEGQGCRCHQKMLDLSCRWSNKAMTLANMRAVENESIAKPTNNLSVS